MYNLNIARALRNMKVNQTGDFIFELDLLRKAVIIQWNAWKEQIYCARKQINRKNPDPRNAK